MKNLIWFPSQPPKLFEFIPRPTRGELLELYTPLILLPDDGFLAGCFPFVDSFVWSNVTNTVRIHLDECIVPDLSSNRHFDTVLLLSFKCSILTKDVRNLKKKLSLNCLSFSLKHSLIKYFHRDPPPHAPVLFRTLS